MFSWRDSGWRWGEDGMRMESQVNEVWWRKWEWHEFKSGGIRHWNDLQELQVNKLLEKKHSVPRLDTFHLIFPQNHSCVLIYCIWLLNSYSQSTDETNYRHRMLSMEPVNSTQRIHTFLRVTTDDPSVLSTDVVKDMATSFHCQNAQLHN